MSEAKFTPGKLSVSTNYNPLGPILDADGFAVAEVNETAILEGYAKKLGINHWADSPKAFRDLSEAELNGYANLIAASPELYRATKYFVEWVDDVWGSDALPEKALKEYEFAKAAIKKAEGK